MVKDGALMHLSPRWKGDIVIMWLTVVRHNRILLRIKCICGECSVRGASVTGDMESGTSK